MRKVLLLLALAAVCTGVNAQSVTKSYSGVKEARTQHSDRNATKKEQVMKVSADAKKLIKNPKDFKKEFPNAPQFQHVKSETRASNPNPQAIYRRPEGYLNVGMSLDYYTLAENRLLGNAYAPAQWVGFSNSDAETLTWEFESQYQEVAPYDFYLDITERAPMVTLPYGYYNAPILTASNGNIYNSYQYGEDKGVLSIGGDSYLNIGEPELALFALGNYEPQYLFNYAGDMNKEDIAKYGLTMQAVVNYFEKPAAKFIIDAMYIRCGNLELEDGQPLTLKVYSVDDEDYLDLIASSEAYSSDAILVDDDGIFKYYTVPFTFKEKDNSGREVDAYLEINTAFIVEFAGYKSAVMWLQMEDHPSGDGYAYIKIEEEGYVPVSYSYGWNTSFLFDFDATFPYFNADVTRYEAPVQGGTNTFEITDYYWLLENEIGEVQWWFEEIPEWIKIGEMSTDPSTNAVSIPVTVTPLPAGETGRSTDLILSSFGCDLKLQVKQGDASFTSIPQVKTSNSKAAVVNNAIQLSYPEDINSVEVYNISGQKVAEYNLPTTGSFSIPAASLSKGVYVLKLAGKTNEVIKIVK